MDFGLGFRLAFGLGFRFGIRLLGLLFGFVFAVDGVERIVPGFVAEALGKLFADGRESLQEELGEIAEGDGVRAGNAVLRELGEEIAEDEVDVGGGIERAGNRSEFVGKIRGLVGPGLRPGMRNAERGMSFAARRAAAASVGEGELAALEIERGGRGWFDGDAVSDIVHRTSQVKSRWAEKDETF